MRNYFKGYQKHFKVKHRKLLLLELAFQAVLILIMLLLVNNVLGYVLKLWGKSYITEENFLSFLLYPPTIILIICLLIVLPLFVLWKMTTMIQYCFTVSMKHKANYIKLIILSFFKTIGVLLKGNVLLPFHALLFYLFINTPLLLVVVIKMNFPGSIQGFSALLLRGMLLVLLLLLSTFCFRRIFTLHYYINEQTRLSVSIQKTKELMNGRRLITASTLLLYNLLILLGFYLIYNLTLILMALMIYVFVDKNMAVTTFLSYYPSVRFYLVVILSIVSAVVNLNLISSLYHTYREESDPTFSLQICSYQEEEKRILPAKRQKRALTFVLLILAAAGMINVYFTIRNDSLFLSQALHRIQIVSHRGSSIEAPENTLPSLEYAIDAHADYAEIDVQQTKDGVLVLLHDTTLKRTTGVNKPLWKMNYEELQTLDAGSWFGEEFADTPIPTLEEVLQLCKGKIKLNIDVKINGYEQELAERLVELIEQYDFKYQCVVSSWNYDLLYRIKQLDNDIRTGQIISAAFGPFYDREYVDFLSLRSSFINKNVVTQVHQAGKEVHAWTVNSRTEMERMKSLGVDSIITDDPHLAKEIVLRNDTNDSFIELLNKMLKNNSLYRLVRQ